MKNIYIFRHGETDWNNLGKLQGQTDIELNEKGILQAKNISKYIKNIEFNKIFTSPLKRAMKTAEIVANDLNIKNIIAENDLIECDFGDGNGVLKQDVNKLFGDNFNENWSSDKTQYDNLKFPNGESKIEVRNRIVKCIHKIISDNKNLDNFLFSSHGFVIKQLIIASGSNDHKKLSNCEIVHFNFDEDVIKFIERIKTSL